MGVQNDAIARLDGDTGERDRLCRFHRHRDLLVIRQKNERQALVGTRISTGDPSRRCQSTHNAAPAEYVGRAALAYALGKQKNENPQLE